MHHPIIDMINDGNEFATPNAARFLCYKAFIGKQDLNEVDENILGICIEVQNSLRSLRGVEPSGTLDDVLSCGSFEEYIQEVDDHLEEMLDFSGRNQLTEAQEELGAFMVAFDLLSQDSNQYAYEDISVIYSTFKESLNTLID